MLRIYKKVGETPLDLLNRLRTERSDLKDETLSYAGRLDPMAEGETIVLVGEEENCDREKYLGLDKEYVATFLVGVKTDTGDILGLIENIGQAKPEFVEVSYETIEKIVAGFTQIKEQTYPWFSGQTVDGIKLFDHYKAGNTDIERPVKEVEIKKVNLKKFEKQNVADIRSYILDSIAKVRGDFRQEEILEKWRGYFDALQVAGIGDLQTFEIEIAVSSGTFIRALTENFPFPATLLTLKRTRIVL